MNDGVGGEPGAEGPDFFEHLVEAMPGIFYLYDLRGRFLRWNRNFEVSSGYTGQEIAGMHPLDFVPEEERELLAQRIERVFVDGEASVEANFLSKSGATTPYFFTGRRLFIGGAPYLAGVGVDIRGKKEAELALRQSEQRVRGTLDNVFEGVQLLDFGWRYLYLNAAAEAQNRRPKAELLGRRMADAWPNIEASHVFSLLRRGMETRLPVRGETEFVFADGSRGWFDVRVQPVPEGILVLSVDVTALRQTEEQLRHAQKMEAVGRLAGGIAHDFNNILSVILSYTELVLEGTEAEQHRADLTEILRAAERATALTRQLLAYSRKQILAPRVLDLRKVVTGMEHMLARLLGEDIVLSVVGRGSPGRVHADPTQIEQIVMNLALNARDAMPRGGKLTLEVEDATLDERYASLHPGVEAGEYVLLAVSDTGTGMDAQTCARIFDPFFTTKEQGKGTGLGLSTVFGIVKQSRGHISVYSEVGVGSTFKVYLPRTLQDADVTAAPLAAPPTLRGTETILLVEDEEQLRALNAAILARNGYRVLEARNGAHALEVAAGHRDAIHLLLTDVVMPGMTGKELAARLCAERPGLRVLYASGYTENSIVHHGVLDAGIAFLPKPITPDALLRKVRETLSSESLAPTRAP